MAHKKGVGSSRNGRDSKPKYRGVKRFGGERVNAGEVIVRQCGTKIKPGVGVALSRDYTIYAKIAGVVTFGYHTANQKKVSVFPLPQAEAVEIVEAIAAD